MYEHQSYNGTLQQISDCDVVIGFTSGKASYIKNRYGGIGTISLRGSVEVLVNVLSVKTGMDFFDDAARFDLVNAIVEVLKKHEVANVPQQEGIKKICIEGYRRTF